MKYNSAASNIPFKRRRFSKSKLGFPESNQNPLIAIPLTDNFY